MTTANNVRRAHDLLDDLDARAELTQEQEKLLRSFLPPRPKQKTAQELYAEVRAAWLAVDGNEWPENDRTTLEGFLYELFHQLKGLAHQHNHPKNLMTEDDYANAPSGTIVAKDNYRQAWVKQKTEWKDVTGANYTTLAMAYYPRRVLRWGETNDR